MYDDPAGITDSIVYMGVLTPGAAALVGGLAVVLLVLLSLGEMRATAWKAALPLLWITRAGALAVLLWMATEPAMQHVTEHVQPQTLRVLVDTSGSMGVVDAPNDDPTVLRWSAALEADRVHASVRELDEAAVALRLAEAALQRRARAWTTGRTHAGDDAAAIARRLSEAEDRLAASGAHLNDVRGALASLRQDVEDASGASERRVVSTQALARLDEVRQQVAWVAGRVGLAADAAARDAVAARGNGSSPPADPPPRLEQVAQLVRQQVLPAVRERSQVEMLGFSSRIEPMPLTAWLDMTRSDAAASTDLTQALTHAGQDLAAGAISAVLLVTDGRHNASASDPAAAAAALRDSRGEGRLLIVPIGSSRRSRDVVVHHVQAPRSVIEGDVIVVEATVEAHAYAGHKLVVELVDESEAVLEQRRLEIGSDWFVRQVAFQQPAEELGPKELTVRVQPLPEERSLSNNQATVRVQVVEDEPHVLLADERARWEYRYLKNLFRRDDRVEHEELLLDPQPETGAAQLPREVAGWERYRVVILGDLPRDALPVQAQEALAGYVAERGGTLVVIAGRGSMPAAYRDEPLAGLLPVRERPLPGAAGDLGWRVGLAPAGLAEPAVHLGEDAQSAARIWSELTDRRPIYDLSRFSEPRETAHVLMDARLHGAAADAASSRAYLSWQRYGRGRVVYIASPTTYRLRFGHGDVYHHRFWGELLRWAIGREIPGGSKRVHLSTDDTRYAEDEAVEVMLRLSQADRSGRVGAQPRIEVVADGQVVRDVALEAGERAGSYRARLRDLPTGELVLRAAGDDVDELLVSEGFVGHVETRIVVQPDARAELRDPRADLPTLRRIAEASGGVMVPATAVELAVRELDLAANVTHRSEHVPLWPRWACLWIFVACLTIEWTLRKSIGLS